MENTYFFLDRNNINSNNYTNESDENDNLLGKFKMINFFTGANSSGKSRFIRNIFYHNQVISFKNNHTLLLNELIKLLNDLIIRMKHSELIINNTHNSNFLNEKEKLAEQYFFYNSSGHKKAQIAFTKDFIENLKEKIAVFNSKLNTQEKLDDLRKLLIGFEAILTCIMNKTVSSKEKKGLYVSVLTGELSMYYFHFYSKEIILNIISIVTKTTQILSKSEMVDNKEKVYIPIIRYANLLFSDMSNTVKEDYLHITIRKQYKFENLNQNDEKIFTGQNLFKEISKFRNGINKQRDNFREFEKFLSINFFENKKIDIVSYIDSENANNNKITFTIDGNEKPFFDIGDGIQSIILLLFPIFTVKEDTWVFIEEPENSLHPLYQRLFIETLLYNEFLNTKNLKYFITTHSNHILDSQFWENENVSISLFRKKNNDDQFLIKTITEKAGFDILKELGALNSSVLIGNCAIWVEGITDRFYIKKMLSLYLEANKNVKQFKENYDYVFFEYAGSNIAHYVFDSKKDLEEKESFIEANKLSNKVFLVADYDLNSKVNQKAKIARHNDLNKISESENWFKYYNTKPRKEIENIISPKILAVLIPKLIPDQSKKEFGHADFEYKEYENIGLGDYLETKLATSNKIKSESGTLSTVYKNQLANLFQDSDQITWDMLSEEAKDLTERIIAFIK